MNHVMYGEDICLMASSPATLQKLIDICYDFSVQNKLFFIKCVIRNNNYPYDLLHT